MVEVRAPNCRKTGGADTHLAYLICEDLPLITSPQNLPEGS